MTQKEETERLVKRFTTFLNYDSISDERWHDPFNADRNRRVKKDAEKLAEIALEEITKFNKLIKKMLYALNQAESAIELYGGKKKPATDFIPSEILAYRLVIDAIKEAQTKANKTDE
jgi:hypothetical protein